MGWGKPTVLVHLANEVLQHLFGDVKIGNNAVFHRPDGLNATGRPAKHTLSFFTNGRDGLGGSGGAHRNNRRFVEHDISVAHIYQGVGRSQIDRQVT